MPRLRPGYICQDLGLDLGQSGEVVRKAEPSQRHMFHQPSEAIKFMLEQRAVGDVELECVSDQFDNGVARGDG